MTVFLNLNDFNEAIMSKKFNATIEAHGDRNIAITVPLSAIQIRNTLTGVSQTIAVDLND